MKYFDKEEKALIESIEKGRWTSNKSRISKIQKLAAENMTKSERINIRLTMKDLKDVKKKAAMEGIPYQTFISSLIHKAANGRI